MTEAIKPRIDPVSPVSEPHLTTTRGATSGPADGMALCLSGGGYRAMLFHLGTLWRLNELGLLPKLHRVSSVSGGSITAGVLAHAWGRLQFSSGDVAERFTDEVVKPIRRLGGTTIDIWSVLKGLILPGTIADKVAAAYDRHLFHGATLQDLLDEAPGRVPRFVFNASNLQSGALFRFSKPYIWDWRVGRINNPNIELAKVVGASSAFPPVLAPVTLEFKESDYVANSGADLQRPPYTTRPVLADGGVYDNMGLETAWKRYRTILVSDAGQKMNAEGNPHTDWLRLTLRVFDLIDNQVRSLRQRQVIGAYRLPEQDVNFRFGAYWGIRTDILDYGLSDTLPCRHDRTLELAAIDTRLAALDGTTQERLINWGYAVCDAAVRKYVVKEGYAKPVFPYPGVGV